MALALACPDCLPARAARAMVFDTDFWTALAVALVPTVLTLLAVWIVHRFLSRSDSVDAAEEP